MTPELLFSAPNAGLLTYLTEAYEETRVRSEVMTRTVRPGTGSGGQNKDTHDKATKREAGT